MSPRPCLQPSRLLVAPVVRPSLTSPSLRSSFHLPRSSAGGRPNYSSLVFFFSSSLLLRFLPYRSLTHAHTPVTQHDISQSFIHPPLLLLSPPSSASLFSLPPPPPPPKKTFSLFFTLARTYVSSDFAALLSNSTFALAFPFLFFSPSPYLMLHLFTRPPPLLFSRHLPLTSSCQSTSHRAFFSPAKNINMHPI